MKVLAPARLLAALLIAGSLTGCAGWSSWEGQRVVPSRPVGPNDYMVVRGDTVYSIAFRNNLDFRELASWNGIGRDYLIHPGDVLRLKPPVTATAPTQRHTSGDIQTTSMADETGGRPRAVSSPAVNADISVPGNYRWVWPTDGVVVRGYDQDGNRGLDFSGKDGQAVLAAAPGKVVYSGNALKGYGELIIIKHDDQYLSAYGYNRSRHVKEGDVVKSGQHIADMGRGPENKPLLHFEIRSRGKPINPGSKLPARAGR